MGGRKAYDLDHMRSLIAASKAHYLAKTYLYITMFFFKHLKSHTSCLIYFEVISLHLQSEEMKSILWREMSVENFINRIAQILTATY